MSIEKLSPVAIPFVGGGADITGDIDFYGTPRSIYQYGIVSFFPIIDISLSVRSVLWDFGDSFTSTELETTHTYRSVGLFTVTLTAYLTNNSILVEQKYYYIEVLDGKNTIPDLSDRASNLLIEEVRRQYGVNRTEPLSQTEIAQIIVPPVIVVTEPLTDLSDRAVNLLNENVRRVYGNR